MDMAHVVLVEKDPTVRAEMRTSLEAEGYTITDVADGVAALKILSERFWPQVVLVGQLTPDLPLEALLRTASEAVELQCHTFIVMESTGQDLPADMMGELRGGLEIFVIDRSACGSTHASDDFERCEFLETLTEASRCAEAN
jgi:CheY-like chemotaxis protein